MKIEDKLAKVGESMTINMYDNGFVFEISGKNDEDDWDSVKIVCSTVEEVCVLIKEATKLPKD
jgi:hypothetical protein